MPSLYDYLVVGNDDGFTTATKQMWNGSSYDTWYIAAFEKDNTIAARPIMAGVDAYMLFVAGGGSGGNGGNTGVYANGGGGGGAGHMLLKASIGGLSFQPNVSYDINVGKGGPPADSGSIGSSIAGTGTSFGYRQFGTYQCPEVGPGLGGRAIYTTSIGAPGDIINNGANQGFTLLTGGNGGQGGAQATYNSDYTGYDGSGASIVDASYGDATKDGTYYLGPVDTFFTNKPLFGTLAVLRQLLDMEEMLGSMVMVVPEVVHVLSTCH
jgi:hypothetical protein